MLSELVYECFCFSTLLISKFGEIKAFTIFEFISFKFNRFNVIKKVIKKGFLNEYIIKIIIKKTIYISFTKSGFEIII